MVLPLLYPHCQVHLRRSHQSLVSPLAVLKFSSYRGDPVCSLDTSGRTVFPVSRSLHEFQPRGRSVDIAAAAEAISLKFSEIPLWHVPFGRWVYAGKWGSSWLLLLCFTDTELWPEGSWAGRSPPSPQSSPVARACGRQSPHRACGPVGGFQNTERLQPDTSFKVLLENRAALTCVRFCCSVLIFIL